MFSFLAKGSNKFHGYFKSNEKLWFRVTIWDTYLSDSSQISNADWWSPPSVEWECGGEEGDAVTDEVEPE